MENRMRSDYSKNLQALQDGLLILGSMVDKAFRRIVDYADGWIPIGLEPNLIKKGRDKLNKLAEKSNRNPSEIDITVLDVKPDKKVIDEFKKAGANRVIISLKTDNKQNSFKELEQIAINCL